MSCNDILTIAAREIGYRWDVDTHKNKYGEWFGIDYVSYCAEFVAWVYYQAGIDLPTKTASCGNLLRWYRKNQPECITKNPIPGCIVIFDFPRTAYDTDHAGIYVMSNDSTITTIDGNTSAQNGDGGGWVQQKTRPLEYANPTFIVPRELKLTKEKTKMEKPDRYNTLAEIKEHAPWSDEVIESLIKRGIIQGGGRVYDTNRYPADLDLSEDMIRLLVMMGRLGLLEEKNDRNG